MFDLIVYCFLGLCVLWDIGLVIYMMFESAQYVRELENICNSHKLSQLHKKSEAPKYYYLEAHRKCKKGKQNKIL